MQPIIIKFNIPIGLPCKKRPRVSKYNNVYTPQTKPNLELHKILIEVYYKHKKKYNFPLHNIYLHIIVYYSKVNKKSPDIDNLLKEILDCLESVNIIKNDRFIKTVFIKEVESITKGLIIIEIKEHTSEVINV